MAGPPVLECEVDTKTPRCPVGREAQELIVPRWVSLTARRGKAIMHGQRIESGNKQAHDLPPV